MATLMPTDTARALGPNAKLCESRSLFFDKFADPSAKDSGTSIERTVWFNRVISLKPIRFKLDSWTRWLDDLRLAHSDMLVVSLQSRLIVNMAGGVMENAGLCLDRFGVPYIPGSAIKGCARRMAVQQLAEAREANHQLTALAPLLADIVLVFGWGPDDWKPDRNKRGHVKSDLVYAVGVEQWSDVSRATGRLLLQTEPQQAKDFGHFAGSVAFLPSYPRQSPPLELDVVTCHHSKYYQKELQIATDDEEPKPVKFIAVAAGATFTFGMLPLRGQHDSLSQSGAKLHTVARDWLRQGLETFGIGAKTAAGYGWFKEAPVTGTLSDSSSGEAQASTARLSKGNIRASEHPLITEWRGKTHLGNFRVFRSLLVALSDDDLKEVFHAIMPPTELANLKRSNPYWQSFTSHKDGVAILKRLRIELR